MASTTQLTLLSTLEGHEERVWGLCWHPFEETLASCSADKTIRIWNYDNEKFNCKAILADGHVKSIRSVDWDPTGKIIASSSFDGTTSLWLNSGNEYECVSTLEGHENEVKCVAWSQDGKYLATCSRDKNIWIWEVKDNFEYDCISVLSGHTQDVKMVKWNGALEMLFSCSYDDTIKAWIYDESLDDWICSYTILGHESTVWSIDFDPTEKYLLSVGDDMKMMIWEVTKKNYVRKCTIDSIHSRCIYSCAWWKNSSRIATGGGDNKVFVYDVSDISNPLVLQESPTDSGHINDVNCVAFHHKSNVLASCSDDRTIKVWAFN